MGCKTSSCCSRTAGTAINTRTSMVRTRDALQDAAVDSSIQVKRELSASNREELLEFVQDQLKCTIEEGLHFLDRLECCFLTYKPRDMVLPILADGITDGGSEVLQKVKDFKAMGGRVAMRLTLEDYEQAFSRQLSVLRELHLRRERFNHKLRKVKAWRKAWNRVFSTVKFAVIVLSVVLAVLAPPAATAVASGADGMMALLQEWADSKWDYYQNSCEAERDITGKILNEASLTFHRVNDVGVLLRRLEVQITSLTHHAEFAIEEDEDAAARLMVVERMKPKAAYVMASVESLEEEMDRRREELRRTALTFLQSVTDQVGNFYNGESDIPVGYENY